jgi:hypothetical protein
MYTDMTDLIVWAIDTNLMDSRPDISLLYYPSVSDFFWFVGRTLFALTSAPTPLPYPELRDTMEKLSDLRVTITQSITRRRSAKGRQVWWDEWLGNYTGKSRGEDRMFSTSLAVNAILDLNTLKTSKNGRMWRPDVPMSVRSLMADAAEYIYENVGHSQMCENAFFSGSVKIFPANLPFFYPATYSAYVNGTKVDPQHSNSTSVNSQLVYTMNGFMDGESYERLTNESWFGMPTPKTFGGYNSNQGMTFPFWSSPALTYSMCVNALSKFVTTLETHL